MRNLNRQIIKEIIIEYIYGSIAVLISAGIVLVTGLLFLGGN